MDWMLGRDGYELSAIGHGLFKNWLRKLIHHSLTFFKLQVKNITSNYTLLMINCLNCNETIVGNFCSNCGQKKFKRIDGKYIFDEVQYSLLHTNKGFLYSVKNILKNPGRTARNFIDGDRVNHYKPLLLAFVLSGVSAFISFKIIGLNAIMKEVYAKEKYSGVMNEVFSFLSSYSSFIMLLLIPVFAVFTWLVFKNWGQNYFEHIVMNAFGLCAYTLYSAIFISPVMFFFRHNLNVFLPLTSISTFAVPALFVWFYRGFYPEHTLKKVILKVLLLVLFGFLLYMALIVIFTIGLIIFGGPEMLMKFKKVK